MPTKRHGLGTEYNKRSNRNIIEEHLEDLEDESVNSDFVDGRENSDITEDTNG